MKKKEKPKAALQEDLFGEALDEALEERPEGMPPLTEIKRETARQGLTEADAQFIHDCWLVNGFKTGRGRKVLDWKACIRVWKAQEFFPSQKQARRLANQKDYEKRRTTFSDERKTRDKEAFRRMKDGDSDRAR